MVDRAQEPRDGVGRRPGLALFCGLNAIPKKSFLAEYSSRITPRKVEHLLAGWHRLLVGETILGDHPLVESHYLSKRSRRQPSILTFLAQDAGSQVFCYSNADICKGEEAQEIFRFIKFWTHQHGRPPQHLVFDSKLTTYEQLDRLDQKAITFITLRHRSPILVAEINELCAAAMRSGERVIIEDVTTSEIFVGQASIDVLIDAEVRAVISTPLMSSRGNLLGAISTHFREPYHPRERELGLMDLLARQAADYLERKRAEGIKQTLIREIQHRGNNQLAVVQAIAHQTLSGDRSLVEAKKVFEARLQALARTNSQLTDSNWSRVNLSDIVRSELVAFADRTIIDGIDVMLGVRHVQNFSLVLHELATNAAKYGALSSESGRIEISWTIAGGGNENILKFKWKERGGPPVVAPARHGFGTSLLKAIFADVRIDYSVKGLTCEIVFLLDRARSGRPSQPDDSREQTSDIDWSAIGSICGGEGR
jgi:two-component sensor histidine kinase